MKRLFCTISFLFCSFSTFAYELKVVNVDGYSKPWLLIYQSEASLSQYLDAQIHLHGFTQDQMSGMPINHNYDFVWLSPIQIPSVENFKRFVEAYGFQKEVQNDSHKIIIIPTSRGHCDQYHELDNVYQFDLAFAQVLEKMRLPESRVRINKASVHSGGGKHLSAMLAKASVSRFLNQIKNIDFFDAVYSDNTLTDIKTWLSRRSFAELRFFSISKQTPESYGQIFFQSYAGTVYDRSLMVDSYSISETIKNVNLSKNIKIKLIKENESKLDHWSIVKELFYMPK